TEDAAEEKHVPVIEKVADGIKVKVGSVPHPMDDDHYIAVIELTSKDNVYRKTLKPGDAPEAVFNVNAALDDLVAKEYCTLHGLWQA
ncbi:MAG: desulfoferrodoxin family protein, partial [Methanobacteriaceae archaeon]